MVESVEENEGVAIFLPFFGEKCVFDVEENEGVAIFLYTFGEKPDFSVEENEGVAIFLYIFYFACRPHSCRAAIGPHQPLRPPPHRARQIIRSCGRKMGIGLDKVA